MASARTSGAGDEPSTWPELLFARSASRVNAMTRIRAAATSCAITKLGADAGACLAAPRAMAISPSRPGMSGVWHIPALAGTEQEYLLWVDVTRWPGLQLMSAICAFRPSTTALFVCLNPLSRSRGPDPNAPSQIRDPHGSCPGQRAATRESKWMVLVFHCS